MTPDSDPRTRLAATLATIAGDLAGLDRELLAHHVARFAPEWERRLGEVLEAARAVLGPELLRGLLVEPSFRGLDGEAGEPFVHDGGVEPA